MADEQLHRISTPLLSRPMQQSLTRLVLGVDVDTVDQHQLDRGQFALLGGSLERAEQAHRLNEPIIFGWAALVEIISNHSKHPFL